MPHNLLLKNTIDAEALTRIHVIIEERDSQALSLLLKKLINSFHLLPQDERLELINIWTDEISSELTDNLPQLLSLLPADDRLLHIPPHVLQKLAKTEPDRLLKIMRQIINLVPEHLRHGLIMPEW